MDRWYRSARSRIVVGVAALALAVGGFSLVRAATGHGDPHQAAAQAEADRMLSLFVPPPGASRASSRPDVPGLGGQPEQTGAETVADSIAWYYAPGMVNDAFGWVNAHWPTEAISHGGQTSPVNYFRFEFGDLPDRSVISERYILATVGAANNGRTVIRVDAIAIWVPSRSSGSIIRSGATSATVVSTNPMNRAPITTTDPAVIRGIVDDINALTPPVPGAVFCGLDRDVRVSITLPGAADVIADPGGCGDVHITIDGKPQQTLSGGGDLVLKVYGRLGVTWTPPR